MRTRKIQHMRPAEIIEAKKERSIAYIPMGPLEWHSYHNPFGIDPLQAELTALATAELAGGIVMPTLYFGSEDTTPPEILENVGVEPIDQYIVGIDYPKNTVKSFYSKEDVFGSILREEINILIRQGYKLIVLVNGHGSTGNFRIVDRFTKEFSNESTSKVIGYTTIGSLKEAYPDLAHAGKVETAIQMYYDVENVDLSQLPPKPETLKYADYAIVDCDAFGGNGTPDKTVEADPRDATAELGKKYIEMYARELSEKVNEAYQAVQ